MRFDFLLLRELSYAYQTQPCQLTISPGTASKQDKPIKICRARTCSKGASQPGWESDRCDIRSGGSKVPRELDPAFHRNRLHRVRFAVVSPAAAACACNRLISESVSAFL